MQAAGRSDHVDSRPQPEMIGVAEDYLCVEIGRLKCFETNTFDSAGSTDRHEDRRFDLTAASSQHTRPRLALASLDLKPQRRTIRLIWRFAYHSQLSLNSLCLEEVALQDYTIIRIYM